MRIRHVPEIRATFIKTMAATAQRGCVDGIIQMGMCNVMPNAKCASEASAHHPSLTPQRIDRMLHNLFINDKIRIHCSFDIGAFFLWVAHTGTMSSLSLFAVKVSN